MNYGQYFAIEKQLKQQGFEFERSEMIEQFTEKFTKRTRTGLSDLSFAEYKVFIAWIKTYFGSINNERHQSHRENTMRRKIIALFHKMGYKLEGSDKINMKRVNEWCVKYGHKHVELNAYSYNELCLLLTQAEKYYKTFIEAL